MSTHSNFDRISEAWLAEGPTQLADRVLDAALDEVHLTRQRRRLPVLWRFNPMPVSVRLAAAAVIGVLLVGVIYMNLPGRNDVGGQGVSPSPSATQAPPSPTQAPPSPTLGSGLLPDGTLAAGRYILKPRENSTFTALADVPSGWIGGASWIVEGPGIGGNGPTGTFVAFPGGEGLYSDPCHWDVDGSGSPDQPDVVVGPSVMNLVDALRANTSYTASTPGPVTFGAFSGFELEIELAPDLTICDKDTDGEGEAYVFPGGMYSQGDSNRWHLFIVDVDGARVVLVLGSFEATPAAAQQAAQAIVDSLEFTP